MEYRYRTDAREKMDNRDPIKQLESSIELLRTELSTVHEAGGNRLDIVHDSLAEPPANARRSGEDDFRRLPVRLVYGMRSLHLVEFRGIANDTYSKG